MKRFLSHSVKVMAFLVLVPIGTASAQLDWLPSIQRGSTAIRLNPVVDGFGGLEGAHQTPTDLVQPPDGSGRTFVTMLRGGIRVLDANGELLPTFLETFNSNTLANQWHFTTMAFHPQFGLVGTPGYGKFYTIETEKDGIGTPDMSGSLRVLPPQRQQVIYEYTMNDAQANVFAGERREVMRVQRPGNSHQMNDLVFGPDGYLYFSNGDGRNDPNTAGVSMSDNAQYMGNIYGKILRIDPLDPALTPDSLDPASSNGKYRVPASNPFIGDPNPATEVDETLDEIYAYGFRNPYRLTFDRATGDLYTGTVGQSNIESVYKVEEGGNHGWNLMEGGFIYDRTLQSHLIQDQDADGDGKEDFAAENGLVEHLFQYDHQDGISVIGGFVYRGTELPELYGKYVFGEFMGGEDSTGRLFYGDIDTKEVFEFTVDLSGNTVPASLFSVGEDGNGELYAMGTTPDGSHGQLLKLTAARIVGDTNGDDVVNLVDLNNVRNNFGAVGEDVIGDAYPADGVVDLEDLNAVRNNFGRALRASVPEPSTAILAISAVLGVAICVRCRRPNSQCMENE